MKRIDPIEIYKWLVNWCSLNPLEVSEYQISVYNLTIYSLGILKCLSFIYKNDMFVMQFADYVYSIRIQRKRKTYKDRYIGQGMQYYTLYHDFTNNAIQLYSDNRIIGHEDLLEWFDKVPRLFDKNGILRMKVFKI